MPKPCGVCVHPSRKAIETAILNQKSMTAIARDFGFTYTRTKDDAVVGDHKAIQRHRDGCMPGAYQRAMEEREVQSGVAIAARLEELEEHVSKVLDEAWKGVPVVVGDVPLLNEDGSPVMRHDLRLVLAAVREGRGNMELLGKLTGRTEQDPEDLDAVRKHLSSPEARRLLAELEALAAAEDDAAEAHGAP